MAGAQGAGKTTLVRALCAEIPKHEAIGTFETEYELHLHELRDQHPIVFAWEARPGSGERGPDGRQAGEFTLSEALFDSFRFNLSRQIVGEVRGHEILAMLKAMESGAGSISTTHAPRRRARSASSSPARWRPARTSPTTTRCARSRPRSTSWSTSTWRPPRRRTGPRNGTGGSPRSSPSPAGRRRRGTRSSTCSAPHPGDREATPHVLDDSYRDLARWGFDLEGFYATARGAAS